MPVLAFPWALLGLAAVPVALGIYLLRSRSRRRIVSSLMLWEDQQRAREGGVHLQRIQTPLLLLLELLALAALALAAANPRVRRAEATPPTVVVLDDSWSMRAGAAESPRARAEAALAKYLRSGEGLPVQFVLAGQEARVLGEAAHSRAAVLEQLAGWTAQAPTADLVGGISLAGSIGGDARILVLTDQAPPDDIEPGKLEWWAFGARRGNLAIVNAARSNAAETGRVLLEVANYDDKPQMADLTVTGIGDAPQLARRRLAAGEVWRLVLKAPRDGPAVTASLPADALEIDNHVTLLPPTARPVRVQYDLGIGPIGQAVRRAVQATGLAEAVQARPEVVFTNRPTDSIDGAWAVRVLSEPNAASYVGPFVVDYAHPLTEGLSLSGVVWAAGASAEAPGTPVISAGNVPLVTDRVTHDGTHDIRIRIRPELSTLTDSANWPALLWNVLRYRSQQSVGLDRVNVRVGSSALLRAAEEDRTVRVAAPGAKPVERPIRADGVPVRAIAPGIYELATASGTWRFAANALSPEESDLSSALEGRWGDWLSEKALRVEYAPIAWVFVLVALAALLGHLALVSRAAGGKA